MEVRKILLRLDRGTPCMPKSLVCFLHLGDDIFVSSLHSTNLKISSRLDEKSSINEKDFPHKHGAVHTSLTGAPAKTCVYSTMPYLLCSYPVWKDRTFPEDTERPISSHSPHTAHT